MKRVLLVVAVIFLIACEQQNQITMTLQHQGEVKIAAGGGVTDVTIDWGDGSEIETYKYDSLYHNGYPIAYKYHHNYSNASTSTVTITGHFTGFKCDSIQIKSFDFSKNNMLEGFAFRGNQLTSLNVKKNTALTWLDLRNNKLTSLDVRKNTALIWLYCSDNQLTGLDVSQNTALKELDCSHNQFSAEALDALFETLHSNDIEDGKTIEICHNPGTDNCNTKIAEDKGWTVK